MPEKWKTLFYYHLAFVLYIELDSKIPVSLQHSLNNFPSFFINLLLVKKSYMSFKSSTLCIFYYLFLAWLDRLLQLFCIIAWFYYF